MNKFGWTWLRDTLEKPLTDYVDWKFKFMDLAVTDSLNIFFQILNEFWRVQLNGTIEMHFFE